MKDAYEILKHKEAELARVRHEVESLRIVALLLDDLDPDQPEKPHLMAAEDLLDIVRQNDPHLKATGTDGNLFTSRLQRRK
jgi:hypothetical protein